MSKISLSTPADVVAAAAPLVGFAPTDSIVVYLLRNDPEHGALVHCAIRFDVTISADQAATFPRTCNLTADVNHATILLAICDTEFDEHAGVVLDTLRDAMEDASIPVLRRLRTRDVSTAGQWYDHDSGEEGPTYPYTDSILAAQTIRDGARIGPSRSDIEREFDPTTPAPPVAVGDHGELVASTAEEIAHVLAGHQPATATLATRAGILITAHPALRDAMLHLALEHEQRAADLWTRIARQLRGRPRAEALTVAAVCHCLASDTVRAGIAIDAAIDEATNAGTPAPTLAHLLLAALQSGIHPARIRDIVVDATRPAQPDS